MLGRRLAGMTQEDLAFAVGVSFQQIQKYESGNNRVAASTLTVIAAAVSQPIGFFLSEKPDERVSAAATDDFGGLGSEERDLARDFSQLADTDVRGAILRLVATIAGER